MSDAMPALVAFPAGALLGSFATVIAHRVPRHEPWALGRSRCPGCGTQIAAYDNVPILSWLWLRGRCRACGERISARYPLAELALATLYALTVVRLGTGSWAGLALGLVLVTVLTIVTLTDLELRVIPNRVLAPAAAAAVAILAVGAPERLAGHLLAAVIAGGILFAIVFAYPRGMGMGDAKLAAVLGLFLGSSVAPALVAGFAGGGMVGVALLALHGSAARKRAIPFGPFLAIGGVVGLWFGHAIVDWYVGTFFGG
jgi:leader peptidase (prepilin peptidase)/N-methyltransferase